MNKLDGLRADLNEIQTFLSSTTRPRVRKLLESELEVLKQEVARGEQNSEQAAAAASVKIEKVQERRNKVYTTKLTNYGWDQSEKFVKIYITLPGVEKLPKEKISANFSPKGVELTVYELEGKNHQLQLPYLLHEIVPAESYVKPKSGSVTVLMKKAKPSENWSHISSKGKALDDLRNKPKEKFPESKDPGDGIMDLMKKMYEDGDDDMKRTIAKAWTESREKQARDSL